MELIKEMEDYAAHNHVPIIRKSNLDYLINLIRDNKYYNILEIGSAIAYSAINMALISEEVRVTTIERDTDMINKAKENIEKAHLTKRIILIKGDAFEIELNDKYDLIFIDGAKAQYKRFFSKFKGNLKDRGVIVSDNVNLLDLQRITNSKRSKRLVTKMDEYKEFLKGLEDFETEFINIGDGFAISKLK